MRTYKHWQINEGYNYTPSIDGKPFEPQTLAQAEVQLQWLSMKIRTAFAFSPAFKQYQHEIVRITSEIDKLADKLGGLDLDLRNTSWRNEGPSAGGSASPAPGK